MSRKSEIVEQQDERHPRKSYELFGQDRALTRAAGVIRSGRPPQGWLISGPPGINQDVGAAGFFKNMYLGLSALIAGSGQ